MIYVYIAVMAGVTYLIRAVPLTVFRKKIENRFVQSFLYYVPYACLTAMTVPGIFYATPQPHQRGGRRSRGGGPGIPGQGASDRGGRGLRGSLFGGADSDMFINRYIFAFYGEDVFFFEKKIKSFVDFAQILFEI